jgi:predicted dehydrogenase
MRARGGGVKVLVIGCGSIGSRHARNLRQLGAEVGLYDVDPKASQPRVDGQSETFGTLEPALAWAESLVVATPAPFHVGHLAHGIARKLPTFVEKPLALTADKTLRDIAALATLILVPVQVGYNLRFHTAWRALHDIVRDGAVGIPDHGRFVVRSDMRAWPGREYADALAECSHEIDQALWCLGPATCVGAARAGAGAQWDLLLAHRSGATSTIHINGVAGADHRSAVISGTDDTAGFVWDRHGGGDEMYVDEMAHFLEVAAGAAAPTCTLQDGLAVLDIMDQARRLAA